MYLACSGLAGRFFEHGSNAFAYSDFSWGRYLLGLSLYERGSSEDQRQLSVRSRR